MAASGGLSPAALLIVVLRLRGERLPRRREWPSLTLLGVLLLGFGNGGGRLGGADRAERPDRGARGDVAVLDGRHRRADGRRRATDAAPQRSAWSSASAASSCWSGRRFESAKAAARFSAASSPRRWPASAGRSDRRTRAARSRRTRKTRTCSSPPRSRCCSAGSSLLIVGAGDRRERRG